MKKKLALVVFICFLVLASIGMSYADDKDVIFIDCGSWDNESGINVGTVVAFVDEIGDLNISILNAYPTYEAYVNFTARYHNASGEDIDVYLTEINITCNDPTAMNISITDTNNQPFPPNKVVHPGDTLDGIATITFLPTAQETFPYWFTVRFIFADEPA